MYPDQQNQNGYQPQPQPPVTPQQNSDGQYTVLPPINNNSRASGHNPYEFIMSPNNQKKKLTMKGLGKGSFGKQIAIFTGGAILVIIIMAVVFSMLAPKSSTPGLLAVAQRQQEILRIASDASRKVNDHTLNNFIVNTNLAVSTNQAELLSYLSAHTKLKPNPKTLGLDHSSKTDQLLAAATSAGTYNITVTQTLKSELTTYQTLLQTTYNQTTSKSAKALLKQDFNDATVLLEQANNVLSAAS